MNFKTVFDMVDYVDKKMKICLKDDEYRDEDWECLYLLEGKGLSCGQIDNKLNIIIEELTVDLYVGLDICDYTNADESSTYVSLKCDANGLWKVELNTFIELVIVESQDINELSSSFIRAYKTAKKMNDEMLESKENCIKKLKAKDHLVIWDKE